MQLLFRLGSSFTYWGRPVLTARPVGM